MNTAMLKDLKVVTMGSAWAGPYIGRVLAEFGAEVFRIAFPAISYSFKDDPETMEAWKKSLISKDLF